jgi:hypothetical protein
MTQPVSEPAGDPVAHTNWTDLVARWLFVGVPLGLGVWRTIDTSLALFR